MSEEEIIELIKTKVGAKILKLYEQEKEQNTILKEIVNKNHETMIDKRYVELNFISKDKIKEIVEKSYNDIDYFKRDIINDIEKLIN